MKNAVMGLLAVVVCTLPATSFANDFSTFTRVQYVTDCMNAHPKMNTYESAYKCSCVIDEIAKVFTQTEFEDLNAGYMYKNMPADYGATFRDNKDLKKGWKLFEATLVDAYQSCRFR